MQSLDALYSALSSPDGDQWLARLYSPGRQTLAYQAHRYSALLSDFAAAYPEQPRAALFSSPGRTEVGGNHTDHNAGRVLAAAVDLDVLAAAAPNPAGLIRVHSAGYPPVEIDPADLERRGDERYTSAALVRGVCARFRQLGGQVGGFDAVLNGQVPPGSGLSSSAAYEMLVAVIVNHFFNQERFDPLALARIAQYAENAYFDKPCGLMDQTTSAVGGFVTIDFNDFENPLVKKVDFDLSANGYALAIVDTGGDHADLTGEYTALENEMKAVARALGGKVLRESNKGELLRQLPALRPRVSDRAVLRAIHFYDDDQRVVEQVQALEAGDLPRFLRLVIASGESSWMLLQNTYPTGEVRRQGIPIGLAASAALLEGRGAWRVHGGGFAGTIQAFVPNDSLQAYVEQMETLFGSGACHRVRIRPDGARRIPLGEDLRPG